MMDYYYLIFLAFGISSLAGYFSRSAGYIGSFLSAVGFFMVEFIHRGYLEYFAMIAAMVWAIISLYSLSYGRKYGKWLSSMLPLMMMGMAIILLSGNYLEIISGWEIMSVPAYVMVAMNGRSERSPFTFMIFSEFSTILLIAGAADAFFLTGSLNVESVHSFLPLLLISLGAMVKMGMTPFMLGEWFPLATGRTPANASAVLSATMTLMGVFLIMKMALVTPFYTGMGIFLMAVGTVTILFSSTYAYISENMKQLAGFSTIENNAAILAGIGLYMVATTGVLREFAGITILIFALSHSIAKTGIFMSIGNTGAETFGETHGESSTSQRMGTFLVALSLSGILPTIGGLGTWMLLEAFFMQAYLGGGLGIISIIVGSVVALSEGMATGGMMKILAFGSVFRKTRKRKGTAGERILGGTGILIMVLFAVSIFFFPASFLYGMPGIGIFNGYMIISRFGPADFGLTSPDYLLGIIGAFTLAILIIIGRPKAREVPVWHGGGDDYMDPYTSYTFSNNIRLLLRRILRTDFDESGNSRTLVDRFYSLAERTGRGYARFSKVFILNLMNSSISWYMIYMIVGFMAVILISVLVF